MGWYIVIRRRRMRQEVLNKLAQDYSKIYSKTVDRCVKYEFMFNGVGVSLYYDEFDEDSKSFIMILMYDKQYYMTSLNVTNSKIKKEYLPELPHVFFTLVLDDNKELDVFFEKIEENILNIEPIVISYSKDYRYLNAVNKYRSKGYEDLPFWWHIRKSRMTDTSIELLSKRSDISEDILRKIQNKNMTLVRTADIKKRKKLKLILDKEAILL